MYTHVKLSGDFGVYLWGTMGTFSLITFDIRTNYTNFHEVDFPRFLRSGILCWDPFSVKVNIERLDVSQIEKKIVFPKVQKSSLMNVIQKQARTFLSNGYHWIFIIAFSDANRAFSINIWAPNSSFFKCLEESGIVLFLCNLDYLLKVKVNSGLSMTNVPAVKSLKLLNK